MSGGGNTQVQTSEPSDFIKPYLVPGIDEARNRFMEGPAQFYPGSTVAGFGRESGQALDATFRRGMNGTPEQDNARWALNQFAGGNVGNWDNYGSLRTLGLGSDYGGSPVAQNLGAAGTANFYRENPVYGTLQTLMSGGQMNHARNLYDRTQDILATGGDVAGYSQGAIGDITATGAGSNSQIRADIDDLITGRAQARNPASRSLGLTANGGYLNANPWLDSSFGQAADAVTRRYQTATAPGVDASFAGRGRYGSGLHANAQGAAANELGDTLSNLATGIYGGNFQAERDRMINAAATQGSQYLQGQGLRASTAGQSAAQAAEDARLRLAATGQVSGDMAGDAARRMQAAEAMTRAELQDWNNLTGGLDRMSGIYDAGAQRQLAANSLLNTAWQSGADRQIDALRNSADVYLANRGQQLQSLGLVPQYHQMGYADLEHALGAGQARDALAQQQRDADIARWDFGQNAPWTNIQRYLSLVNGGSPSMTTSTTGGTGPSWLSALGSLARGFSR